MLEKNKLKVTTGEVPPVVPSKPRRAKTFTGSPLLHPCVSGKIAGKIDVSIPDYQNKKVMIMHKTIIGPNRFK